MIGGNSIKHLHYFLNKIKHREPFGLIRPNDGEYLIMLNKKLTNIDDWTFQGGVLRDDLIASIKLFNKFDDTYIGLPCKDCFGEGVINDMINSLQIDKNKITYANLVCNKNWSIFTDFLINNKTEFYYIGSGTQDNNSLNIKDRFIIDEKLVNNWDSLRFTFLKEFESWFQKNHKDGVVQTFLFSAGPISKILIPYIFNKFPNCRNNQLIDCGSSLDYFLKNKMSRSYMDNKDSNYRNLICDFELGHNYIPEITCILSCYKRPYTLLQQINAIKNQTIPPKKIIVWYNHAEGYSLPNEIRNDKDVSVIESSDNFGVWGRFAIANLSTTEFVNVIDDDTIPGNKWFENCIETMYKVNGLLGTMGVIFEPNCKTYNIFCRYGWNGQNTLFRIISNDGEKIVEKPSINNENIEQVDILCHSWFFRKEWLSHLWSLNNLDYKLFLRSGEDIGFSYALQKVGINSYVPPHPKDNIEMFGSIPNLGIEFGEDGNGISSNINNNLTKAYKFFRNLGFKNIKDSNN